MQNLSILITNDDGPASPFLLPLIGSIIEQPWCRELHVVIPDREQSWIAKATSRFSTLIARPHCFKTLTSKWSCDGHLVNGTPADCCSLGINNLYSRRPDLVISGINMGTNAGTAFLLSSGTVGAAIEANLYKVKSIAFSAHLPPHIFQAWRERREDVLSELHEEWKDIASLCTQITSKLLATDAWDYAMLYSANIPWETNADTKCKFTSVTPTFFQRLFVETAPLEFEHSVRGLQSEDDGNPLGDVEVLSANAISITPIKFDLTASLPEFFVKKFAQRPKEVL